MRTTRMFSLASAAVALFGGLLVAPNASAYEQGCTFSEYQGDTNKWICTNVGGGGEYVSYIEVKFKKPKDCRIKFKVWGTLKNGKAYRPKPATTSCSTSDYAVWKKDQRRRFKAGTKICAAIVEDGRPHSQHACVPISK